MSSKFSVFLALLVAFGIAAVFLFGSTGTAGLRLETVTNTESELNQGLVAHYTFDGADVTSATTTDVTGNGNDGTINGDPQPVIGKIGQAFDFDGADDIVDVPDDASFSATSAVSVSGWVRFDSLGNNDKVILGHYDYPNDQRSWALFYEHLDDTITFRTSSDGSSTTDEQFAFDSVGTWHHIAFTYANGDAHLYLDGTEQSTSGTPASTLLDSTGPMLIGAAGNVSSNASHFDGGIAGLRVYDRSLSSQEIQKLYNQGAASKRGATPDDTSVNSQKAGPELHMTFDGPDVSGSTVDDVSGNNNDGTINGDPVPGIGVIGQAFEFDGDDDYIKANNDSELSTITNSEHTITAWVQPQETTNSFHRIVQRGGSDNPKWWALLSQKGNLAAQWDDGAVKKIVTADSAFTVGEWYHMVARRHAGSYELFIDGVKQADTEPVNNNFETSDNLSIGARINTLAEFFKGSVDGVRVYSHALSVDEITRLFNQGRETVATSNSENQGSGLVGMWTFDGGDVSNTTVNDVSGQGNDGTINGDPQPAIGKIGQAFDFDGSDDEVSISDSAQFTVSDVSVSAWVKTTTAGDDGLVSNYGGTGSNQHYGLRQDGDGTAEFYYDDGGSFGFTILDSNMGISDGAWHHVLGVFESGVAQRIYVDGELANTNDNVFDGTLDPSPSADLLLGNDAADSNDHFKGSLDNVRIYDRALNDAEVRALYNIGR